MSSEDRLCYGKVAHRRRQREASSQPAPTHGAAPNHPGHLTPRVQGTQVTLSPHGRCGAVSSIFCVTRSGEGTKEMLKLSPSQERGERIITILFRAPREYCLRPQTSRRRRTCRVHSGSAHREGRGLGARPACLCSRTKRGDRGPEACRRPTKTGKALGGSPARGSRAPFLSFKIGCLSTATFAPGRG